MEEEAAPRAAGAGVQAVLVTEGVGAGVPSKETAARVAESLMAYTEAATVPVRARRATAATDVGAATGHAYPEAAWTATAGPTSRGDEGGAAEARQDVVVPGDGGATGIDSGTVPSALGAGYAAHVPSFAVDDLLGGQRARHVIDVLVGLWHASGGGALGPPPPRVSAGVTLSVLVGQTVCLRQGGAAPQGRVVVLLPRDLQAAAT